MLHSFKTLICISAIALVGCETAQLNQAAQAVLGTPTAAAAPVQGSPGCKPLNPSNVQSTLVGLGAGAAIGGALGASMANNRSVGLRNGLLIGALLGGVMGNNYKSSDVQAGEDGTAKLNVPGSVLFRTGSADLTPGFTDTLNRMARTIREYCGLTAVVIGHTDNVGNYASNRLLSERRAQSVANYLVQQSVEPYRISIIGRSSDVPLVSNADESGRAQNRRVEILIKAPTT